MIVIMGPGRCGTTLVVRVLQAMGYDTGGSHEIFRERRDEIAKGGFPWPKVIKGTGTLCYGLNRWAGQEGWDIEMVILCRREIEANVRSMIKKKRNARGYRHHSPEELEKTIRFEVADAYKHAEEEIQQGGYRSITIDFPKSGRDSDYCYSRLKEAIPDLNRERFKEAWDEIVDPKLIRFGG